MDETTRPSAPITARDIFRVARRRLPLFLFTFAAVVAATFYATSLMKPVYEAKARVQVDSSGEIAIPSNVMDIVLGRGGGASLETEIEKIGSRPFLQGVIRRIGLKKMTPELLKSKLALNSAAGGKILDISVRTETAKEAAQIANAIAADYISLAQEEYVRKTELSQRRLKEAQAQAKTEKKQADEALADFKARVGMPEPSLFYAGRANKIAETKNALEDARRSISLQQANLATKQERLKHIPAEVMNGYTLNKNPVIDGYRAILFDLETQKKKLLVDYLPDSDEVLAIDAEIKARREAIAKAEKTLFSAGSRSISRNGDYSLVQSEIQRSVLDLLQTQNGIAFNTRLLATLQREQKKLTPEQTLYEGLLRKRQSATDAYEQARLGLLKLETTRILSAPDIQVMESAIPPIIPISPKPWLNAAMAIALGLFLGLCMALWAEYMASGNVVEEELPDLPRLGGAPLLGVLPIALPAPAVQNPDGLPAPLTSAATEDALREIGFTLAHRHPKDPVPVALLAGARTDDTSAALAAQLAAMLVREGARVTLVDADRGRSRLSAVFGAPNAPGLADVLAGRKKVKEILHRASNGSLRFLAAGAPDDNVALTEAGLRGVFKELADGRDTDIVLVSGPSVWQVGLISPLERAATGMVLVATEETRGPSPAESVSRARRLLSNGYRPRILGVVVGMSAEFEPPAVETASQPEKALVENS